MSPEKKIVIIGSGPTGLGAGYRLHELGYTNWQVYEHASYPGGLSASFTDKNGFTWDVGGHVLFSHFPKFDSVLDAVLGNSLISHVRDSWVYLLNKWVPYPLQNNLKFLPKEVLFECLMGLHSAGVEQKRYSNFKEWIWSRFGSGISKYFMYPYNEKVWCTDLASMSFSWIAERISVIEFEQALKQVIYLEKDSQWGPNETFKYPICGGIGEIFRRIAQLFSEHVTYKKTAVWIDLDKKKIGFADGSDSSYDHLISTMPLDCLVNILRKKPDQIMDASRDLVNNKCLIVGLGINGATDSKKSWIYYPESHNPCFRVTYLSNYSPNMTPVGDAAFSLLGEISYSTDSAIDAEAELRNVIAGYQKVGVLNRDAAPDIKSVFTHEVEYAYPVPSLQRDRALAIIQPFLEEYQVYSRGRFGSWKYEIGNMDHSFIQGYENVDKILGGVNENVFNF